MVGSIKREPGCQPGGIISLAAFADEHHKALEYDLMQCGFELKDVGHSITWGALHSFIQNLGLDSAMGRELNPDLHQWSSTLNTNRILADIFDMLAQINANLVAIGSHKPSKKPKAYPRPGAKNNGDKYGSKAVPVDEMRKMFADKRKRKRKNG